MKLRREQHWKNEAVSELRAIRETLQAIQGELSVLGALENRIRVLENRTQNHTGRRE